MCNPRSEGTRTVAAILWRSCRRPVVPYACH
jgi:hypothetical protein